METMKTIYEHTKQMNVDEFRELIWYVYLKGVGDGNKRVDDEVWMRDIFPFIDSEQWKLFCSSSCEFDDFKWSYTHDDFEYSIDGVKYKKHIT